MKLYDVSGLTARYVRPATNLTQWAAAQHPDALCNASLYDMKTRVPVGTVIESGQLVHNDGNGYGVGIIGGKLEFGKPWDRAWEFYLTGYTACVQEGKYVPPAFTDRYVFDCALARIGMARMRDGRVCVVTDDGVTLKQFADHAVAQGVETLANLDGGGSRHLLYDGATVYSSLRVPYNALAFYKPVSVAVPSPSEYPVPTRNLYFGCRGEDVKWLQDQLMRRGYNLSGVDGIFGPNTWRETVAYQRTWTRWPDGICGSNTRGHLLGTIK